MKCHKWTATDEERLMEAIHDCEPLFKHYKNQGTSYSDMNAWDAIAGRLLPDVVVTGAACRRRCEVMKARDIESGNSDLTDEWERVSWMVDQYERDLAESTFDRVEALLGQVSDLVDTVTGLVSEVRELKKMWESLRSQICDKFQMEES